MQVPQAKHESEDHNIWGDPTDLRAQMISLMLQSLLFKKAGRGGQDE